MTVPEAKVRLEKPTKLPYRSSGGARIHHGSAAASGFARLPLLQELGLMERVAVLSTVSGRIAGGGLLLFGAKARGS